jgi:hypothetical protein
MFNFKKEDVNKLKIIKILDNPYLSIYDIYILLKPKIETVKLELRKIKRNKIIK